MNVNMVYSLGRNLVCENLTVQNIFKAEKVDSNLNVSGDITASQTMKCHTLNFDRTEYTQIGTQAPNHFHKYEHLGSMVLRLYMMKMRIDSIETTSGSADAIVTLFQEHGIVAGITTAECKFTGTFEDADVNGITASAGFKVNSSHRNIITPHPSDAKKMTVRLSEAATLDGTVSVGLSNVILEFPRWFYVDMAKTDGWQFAYGYVAPAASYN